MLQQELTYLGDRRDALKDRVVGPDFHGGYARVAETTFDGTWTVARFEAIPPREEV